MATCRNSYSDKVKKEEDDKVFPALCDEYYHSFCRQYGIDPVAENSTPKKGNKKAKNRLKTCESHSKYLTKITRRGSGRKISRDRHFPDTVTWTREFEAGMIERKRNLMGRVHDQLLNASRERNESYQDFLQFLDGNKTISRDRKVDFSWCVTSQRPELLRRDRDWNITMDKLLRIEKELEDSEDDDCFVPRKLFFFQVDTFKEAKASPAQGPRNRAVQRDAHKQKRTKTEKKSASKAPLMPSKKTDKPEQQKKSFTCNMKGMVLSFFGVRQR
ncbi:uncharacterized protein LOC134228555 isoform X2 [Saccostrea cucullata]|uniref:uncharacterized protein LOC134228555 isoform X2 n=1 Tax=Saccostrea cuccullata TaxID=36930 RepID=UPI002ED2477A